MTSYTRFKRKIRTSLKHRIWLNEFGAKYILWEYVEKALRVVNPNKATLDKMAVKYKEKTEKR